MEQYKKELKEDLQVLRIDREQPARRASRVPGWVFPLVGVVVLLVAGWGLADYLGWWGELGFAAKPVRVAVATRRGMEGPVPVLSAGGYIIARNQVEVGSKITGRVVSLKVDEGDIVKQGQVIARLDDYEVSAQVEQARANLAAARARLAQLEAGSRPQEIQRANAQMERAQADRKNAEQVLHRTERLVREGVLDAQTLDDARARYDMALNAFQAAKEDYELMRIGPRQEEIDLARAQVHQADAALAFARAQLQNTIIRAPVSGTVLDRYVDLGEMVTTGFTSDRGAKQALVSIADLSDLQVELDITEADIAKVQLDQPTVITPDAYLERHYEGIVEYIAAAADRQKATIQVKVKVLNPDRFLRPDMGAKVTFYNKGTDVPQAVATVMVPKAALVTKDGQAAVFLVKEEKAVLQPVTVGHEGADYVEILEGLKGGETVILSGQTTLEDGDKVAVQL